ncbi:hypothetical protein PENFLA_c015G09031 [Penicillium flavigenum]|uniref:AMP-dependent synthetase/ligase domain-containing protein n=1 Tax=Penicillium flavigenum TaxID=254877 RepID=A0A1V6T3D5_9EURO|nr:hypothetical protein PENFLA_c015G09031 [Penicillium flavigenum]
MSQQDSHHSFRAKPSYTQGFLEPALRNWTFGDLLQRQAEQFPGNIAISCPGTSNPITYHQLNDRTKLLGKALIAIGISVGDRVGIFAGNVLEYVEVTLATARIGAIIVLLNTFYTTEEIKRALRFTGQCILCSLLFITESLGKRSLLTCIDQLNEIIKNQKSELPDLRSIVLLSGHCSKLSNLQFYTDFVKIPPNGAKVASAYEAAETQITAETVCNFQFTSGTTGMPKAVMLTHFNVINNGFLIGDRIGLAPNDTICCPWPLFHSSGFVVGLITSLCHGATLVLPSPIFDPAATARALISKRCTGLQGVPTMFAAVLEWCRQRGTRPPPLRTGIIGASPVSPALLRDLQHEFGLEDLGIAYGMTETSPLSFLSKGFQSDGTHAWMEILPHTTAKIVDAQGIIVPIGSPGELCVSGYLLQQGYYQNPGKTREDMRVNEDGDLWIHSGDEAIMDEQGRCRISGRIKDTIIRGGENIYPAEIEDRLNEHPAISMSAVVGIQDAKYGEAVAAFLQLKHGENPCTKGHISEWVQQTLGKHKVPELVFHLGVDGVPGDLSGKIKKVDLVAIGTQLVRGTGKL